MPGPGPVRTGMRGSVAMTRTRRVTSARRTACSIRTSGRRVQYTRSTSVWLRDSPEKAFGWCLACMVENDFPSMRSFAPHEREDAVVFGGFAVFGAVQVELAGDEGDLGFTAA